jgi:hypothetical protein
MFPSRVRSEAWNPAQHVGLLVHNGGGRMHIHQTLFVVLRIPAHLHMPAYYLILHYIR